MTSLLIIYLFIPNTRYCFKSMKIYGAKLWNQIRINNLSTNYIKSLKIHMMELYIYIYILDCMGL